jgi:hypothetical protein
LSNQQIASPGGKTPGDVVAAMGAVQAQDFLGALWAIGLRLPAAMEADIERAIAERTIVRTWPMRGTLHFVAAADVRWMLELLTPRIVAGSAWRHRELELDDTIFSRCRKLFTRALEGGRRLTRDAMYQVLERSRISASGQRGIHVLCRLAQEGLICFGPREGKQPTFVLLDEWVPDSRRLERGEALTELARRYFTSHGPATLADFVWWSGLKVSDARAALEMVSAQLARETIGGATYWMRGDSPLPKIRRATHLLPGFDEYLLGYKDRSAVLDLAHAGKIVPGSNGQFLSTIVINGRVVGTWKRELTKKSVVITASPFAALKKTESRALAEAAQRYGKFLGRPAELVMAL